MLIDKPLFRAIVLILIFLSQTCTITCAQEIDDYLLWAKVPDLPARPGATVNQSDMDAQRNLYVIGSFFKQLPWKEDSTQIVGFQHIFVHKYDTDGNLLWSKEFGTNEYYSYGGDIRIDKDGNIVLTGYLYDLDGTALGQPMPGFFLSKMDSDGNFIWIKPLSKMSLLTWGGIGQFW